MSHSGLKTVLNERKFTAQVFIQHHRTVQPHTAILRLARALLKSHTTCMDQYWTWEKQPPKSDLVDYLYSCEFLVKN